MALRVGKGCQTYLDALAQTTEIRMFDIVSRNWNDTPIQRRTTDGYVNATAMCKANVKNWSAYRETDRCQGYIDALSDSSDFRGTNLIESRSGNGGGTWVHPQVAVDLARWISAPFAVWMEKLCGSSAAALWVRELLAPALRTPTASTGRIWRLHAARGIRPKSEGRWVTLVGRSTSQMASLSEIVLAYPSPPSARRVKLASFQPLSNQEDEPIGEKSIGATGFEPAT